MNFLAGKRVDEVNKMAELGTQLAHVDGGVPNMRLIVPELNEYYLGEIIYFFEKTWYQRLFAGSKSVQPTGRGSIQEKYVCFVE